MNHTSLNNNVLNLTNTLSEETALIFKETHRFNQYSIFNLW